MGFLLITLFGIISCSTIFAILFRIASVWVIDQTKFFVILGTVLGLINFLVLCLDLFFAVLMLCGVVNLLV